jgi:hypothetical protein
VLDLVLLQYIWEDGRDFMGVLDKVRIETVGEWWRVVPSGDLYHDSLPVPFDTYLLLLVPNHPVQ